jgi:hypothetical protein
MNRPLFVDLLLKDDLSGLSVDLAIIDLIFKQEKTDTATGTGWPDITGICKPRWVGNFGGMPIGGDVKGLANLLYDPRLFSPAAQAAAESPDVPTKVEPPDLSSKPEVYGSGGAQPGSAGGNAAANTGAKPSAGGEYVPPSIDLVIDLMPPDQSDECLM